MTKSLRTAALSLLVAGGLVATGIAPVAAAAPDVTVRVVAEHAPDAGVEGLTVDRSGRVWEAVMATGEVLLLDPSTGRERHVATLDPGAGLVLGMAPAPHGGVYAAVASFVAGTHGVWHVGDDGRTVLVAEMPLDTFPNGLAVDVVGRVFVSDSLGSGVWRVDPERGTAEVWWQHELGAPTSDGLGFGANGLAFDRDGSLLVVNTDQGTVVRVGVAADGSAAATHVVAQDELLTVADGVAVGPGRQIYVTASYRADRLLQVSRNGKVTQVASAADGLSYSASIAFGRTPEDRLTMYVGNVAMEHGTAGVLAVDLAG